MNGEFEEPRTIEEAEERRIALTTKMIAIQGKLTEINDRIAGRRLPQLEFARLSLQRKNICDQKDVWTKENFFIKEWIRQHNKNLARTVLADEENIRDVAAKLTLFANRARDLIGALRLRIEELLTENAALHNRLQALELENTNVAPDHRREAWRQDENLDVHKGNP
jgi:hypothetical protein